MLEAKSLVKTFLVNHKPLYAVRGVDFTLEKGETLAIVGESGSGKSTIANLLLALDELTEGEIFFEGKKLTSKRSLIERRDIQVVFQDPHSSFNPRMTMGEALREPLYVQGLKEEGQIEKMTQLVGLEPDVLSRYPHAFSGGQLQRLAIARALLLKPKLLILDEPLSSLDLSHQAQTLQLLKSLKDEFDLTLLFITHDLQVVRAFADRTVVLYLGKVMEEGSTRTLFEKPEHPYTEALLSSIPPQNPWNRRDPMSIGSDLPSPFHPPSGCPFRTRCPFAKEECAKPIPEKREGDHRWWCVLPKKGS